MKPVSSVTLWASLALAAAALASGCASPPDRYYTLATPAGGSARPAADSASAPPLAIELAPVILPDRFARPQLLVRKNADGAEVRVLEQHRWAASFEIELRDALAAGIASRLGAVDATRRAQASAWRIAVQLREFDAIEGSRVDAGFTWNVRRPDGDAGIPCPWRSSEPAAPDIPALAAGAQRVTAQLAEAIAQQVRALQADPKAGCVGRAYGS